MAEPPQDQRKYAWFFSHRVKRFLTIVCRFRRLGIHYFVKLLPDVRIDIPLIQGPDDQFREYRELGGKAILYGGTLGFLAWAREELTGLRKMGEIPLQACVQAASCTFFAPAYCGACAPRHSLSVSLSYPLAVHSLIVNLPGRLQAPRSRQSCNVGGHRSHTCAASQSRCWVDKIAFTTCVVFGSPTIY